MRPKYQNFEELVKQNKQELLEDEQKIKQIEQRLDKKATKQKTDKINQLS
ncbi:FbpB family small basic protein [Lentibacillus salicampi]|uniref:FbpB family small basic protein n=1 Tax=Lentibacillus salicampi TaxID=175306 RepID=A0A4Y9AHC5_9BACI|nr:FbpB family small basic protein [Lentibacillus salicampi]TFJ94487.1 FbpB family small basic protein [Lentibacillus salicampi]